MPKTNIDFQNLVIYKIVCNDINVTDSYVGSTTNFTKRKSSHKSACTNVNDKHHKLCVYQFIRKNGNWENWSMIEIEKYPCNSLNDAHKRERYWLENLKATLNVVIPSRSKQEYWKTDKSKLSCKLYKETRKYKDYNKIYQKTSKVYKDYHHQYNRSSNRRKQHRKIEFICLCGSVCKLNDKSQHFKTLKHQQWINKKEKHKAFTELLQNSPTFLDFKENMKNFPFNL